MNTPEVKEQDGQNPEDADGYAAAPPKKYHTRRVVYTIIGLVIYFVGVNVWREYRSGAFDPDKKAAKAAYERGRDAQYNKEDYDLAIAEYTEAIRLAPNDNESYYFQRAQIYAWPKEEYDKAIADYKESIRLGGSYASYYAIGDCYFEMADYAEAIDYYEQALTRAPDNSIIRDKLEEARRQAAEPRGRESINRVVSRNMGPLRDAYDKRRIDKPELSGKITVKLAIDESGNVASVQLVNSTMNDREFEDYVASKVKEWTFGKTEKVGDTVSVVLPLFFGYGG
jgi:tetratricopeptide (TPR) repeat protein